MNQTTPGAIGSLDGRTGIDPDGHHPVRGDDGVHFCPAELDLPCPTYSSGAFRFATAIARALEEPRAAG